MAIDFKYIDRGTPTVDFFFRINWSKEPAKDQCIEFSKLIHEWGWEGINGKFEGWLNVGGHFDSIGDVKMVSEKTSEFDLDAGTTEGLEKGLESLNKQLDDFNEKAKKTKDWAIIESIIMEG